MTFLKRLATTVVGLPLVIYIVYVGGSVLAAVGAGVALVGLREFYIAFSGQDRLVHGIGYLFTVLYFVAIVLAGSYWLLAVFALFVLVAQAVLVLFYRHIDFREMLNMVYGFVYVPFLFSFVLLVRGGEYGQFFVWLIFTAGFGCDTFAYITGVLFGKHKLVNSPSPSKSVEGLIGGIIGAGLVGLLFGVAMTQFFEPSNNFIIIAAIVSLVGALFGIVGDLAASAVKRHCEIKDFGQIFPGHGGVLDRADSILMIAPVVFIAMQVLL